MMMIRAGKSLANAEYYQFVKTTTIISLIPLNIVICLLGLSTYIWILYLLNQDLVKTVFEKRRLNRARDLLQ